MAERRERYKPDAVKQAQLAWKRFLGQTKVMPWEVSEAEVEAHKRWLEAEGYARSTISNGLGYLEAFFRWCGEQEIDRECGWGFNPAAAMARPKIRRYDEAPLLSRNEVSRLLETLRGDASSLGKREYAFFLARLRLGVPLGHIQRLRWGQIEEEEGGMWVRCREEGERRSWRGRCGRRCGMPGSRRAAAGDEEEVISFRR